MQDRSKWDRDSIGKGFHFLDKSATGNELSEYHLEAGIAALHSSAASYEQTEWDKILELYNVLYQMKPSPIVALNRAIALGKSQGPDKGLRELDRIADSDKLKNYPFYPAARGEFQLLAGRPRDAAKHFERAKRLARTRCEIDFFERKLRACRLGTGEE